MKNKEKQVRNKVVIARMNEDELKSFTAFFKQTTCRHKSEYLRKLCLQKPVVIKYRNQSADDLLSGLIKLKNELNAIGNNYNQAVHKLHISDRIPEVKAWLVLHEPLHREFQKKVEEIKERMNQIYQQWSQ